MLEIASAPVPEFMRLKASDALEFPTVVAAKVKVAGVSAAMGVALTPVPVSAAECGLPDALSITVMAAARDPASPGVKMTVNVQCVPAPKVAAQSFVCEKSPRLAPVIAMLAIFRAAVPVLKS
jgi:hypothetical protein